MENDSQKRTSVAFGLIFLLTAVYMTWFAPSPAPPHADASAVDAGTVATSPAPVAPSPGAVEPPPPTPPSSGAPPAGSRGPHDRGGAEADPLRLLHRGRRAGLGAAPGRDRTRDQHPLTIAEGWAQLFGKAVPKGPQMDLAQPVPGAPLPLSVELAGEAAVPATLRYSVEEGDHRLTFVGRTESWEVTKEVSWIDDGYELSTQVTLRNLTGAPALR